MSDPIPLMAADDGKVYAYLCGNCRHLHVGAESMAAITEPSPACVDLSRECADRCCRCRLCQAIIGTSYVFEVCAACKPAEDARQAELSRQIDLDRARRRAAYDMALAQAKDKNAAQRLSGLMSYISEEQYCAGWLHDLEYELWDQAFGSGRPFGAMFVADQEPRNVTDENQELRQLSEQAGGWWHYADGFGELFVPTETWLKMLASHQAGMEDESNASSDSDR